MRSPTSPRASARMHALRIELAGPAGRRGGRRSSRPSPGSRPSGPAGRRTLPARTDGNPFFLVEFARLAGERADLGGCSRRTTCPRRSRDVLNRRLLRLPEHTVGRAADRRPCSGRDFDTPTLAGRHRDRRGRPARRGRAGAGGRAGPRGRRRPVLLRARAGPRHPARRDERQPPGPRCTPGSPRRSTGVARPRDRAGPALAGGRARRTPTGPGARPSTPRRMARRCTPTTRRPSCCERRSTRSTATPRPGRRERYDVLMAAGRGLPLGGPAGPTWSAPSRRRSTSASSWATRRRSPGRRSRRRGVAVAAPAPPGEVNELVVAALRGSLDRLPARRQRAALPRDARARQRAPGRSRRTRSARALSTRAWRWPAGSTTRRCCWTPTRSRSWRCGCRDRARAAEPVDEALRAGPVELGDERALRRLRDACGPWCSASSAAPTEMWAAVEARAGRGRRLRIAFGEMVLDGIVLPWLAMAGRFDECDRAGRAPRGPRTAGCRTATPTSPWPSALLAVRLWQGRPLEWSRSWSSSTRRRSRSRRSVAVYLWRAGEHDRARAYYAEHGAAARRRQRHLAVDLVHGGRARAATSATRPRRPRLRARSRRTPGRCSTAGSELAHRAGRRLPGDGRGRRRGAGLAARHADDALVLAEAWGLPLFADWIRDQRSAYGY